MEKIGIVFWSGTGNTEAMAEAITQGAKEVGAEVSIQPVSSAKVDEVASFSKLALGCPSMGDEVLEEGDFEPFFADLEPLLKGKKLALFGSYGWGDGKWMRDWVERCQLAGALLYDDGLIVSGEADTTVCHDFGKAFGKY